VKEDEKMAESWEAVHLRGQQTIGMWTTFAPDFVLASLTLAQHTADVAEILTRVNDRDVQQATVALAAAARDDNYNFIRDLNTRAAQVIDGLLDVEDDLHTVLDDVYAADLYTQEGNLTRARRLIDLWTRLNAARAALTPALPPLLIGTVAGADLQAAVTRHADLLQTLDSERHELSQRRSRLSAHVRQVDRNNKRLYAVWSGNFPVGTPEHEALRLIDTEEGTTPPTALEIDALTQTGLSVAITYVAGGGRRATSLQLLYQLLGAQGADEGDDDYGHPTPVVLAGQTIGPFEAGQTVNLKTVAENSAGAMEGAVRTIALT